MRLVPRQLLRAGMTGNVPYYGGRLTPWHINALSRPAPSSAQVPPPLTKDDRTRLALQRFRSLVQAEVLVHAAQFGQRDGDVLMFEANATMVIAKPNNDPHWAYRHGAIDRVLKAVVAMIVRRSIPAGKPSGASLQTR